MSCISLKRKENNILPLQWQITLPHSLFLLKQARFPTINKCLFALVSATFILFSESMNPNCLVLTHDKTIISFSAPWKASTVDTWTALVSNASDCTPLSRFWICRRMNMDGDELCYSQWHFSWAKNHSTSLSLHKMRPKKGQSATIVKPQLITGKHCAMNLYLMTSQRVQCGTQCFGLLITAAHVMLWVTRWGKTPTLLSRCLPCLSLSHIPICNSS